MHSKKRIAAASIIAAAALAIMALYVLVISPRFIEPAENYYSAVKLYNNGDYLRAALAFDSLKGYSDSETLAKLAWRQAGDAAFEKGRYSEAHSCYERCDPGDEALVRVDECMIRLAQEAFSQGLTDKAEIYLGSVRDKAAFADEMDTVRAAGIKVLLEYGAADDIKKAAAEAALCSDKIYPVLSELFFNSGVSRLGEKELDAAADAFAEAKRCCADEAAMTARIDAEWKAAGDRAAEAGDTDTAKRCYAMMEGPVDPSAPAGDDEKYRQALMLYENGDCFAALSMLETMQGETEASAELTQQLTELIRGMANAGADDAYAMLGADGAVRLSGSGWPEGIPDITGAKRIAMGYEPFVLVLREDGTVQGFGYAGTGRLETEDWSDIVAVACGGKHSIGLRSDGTVVSCGFNMYGQGSTSYWSNIVSIAAGVNTSYAVSRSGRAYAIGSNDKGQCEVSGWENITSISAGAAHAVGLRSDGTVAACGDNSMGQCDTEGWRNIVLVSAGADHTVGLRGDGTLVACGDNSHGECDVEGLTGVRAVSCGDGYTLVVLSDGSIRLLGVFDPQE